VTLLIDQGIHIKVIQEGVGHSSVRTTLDVYGHLFEGLDQATAGAIDTAFGGQFADSS
jgi:integrase